MNRRIAAAAALVALTAGTILTATGAASAEAGRKWGPATGSVTASRTWDGPVSPDARRSQ
jgi:hypothetical protein